MDADGRARLAEGDELGVTSDLDAPGLPRTQHLVDDDGDPGVAAEVAVLLRGGEVHAAYLDAVDLGLVAVADRCHVGRSVRADRGDAGETAFAAVEEVELGVGEVAHGRPPHRAAARAGACPRNRVAMPASRRPC